MPVPDFAVGEVLTSAAMDSIGLWLVASGSFGPTASEVLLDDVFTSDYLRYQLIFDETDSNTAGITQIQFRTSGSNNATGNYSFQTSVFTSASFFTRNTGTATQSDIMPNVGASGWRWKADIFGAETATNTIMTLNGGASSGAVPVISSCGFTTTTVFDGIRIFRSAGTMSGSYALYGMRN
jgi:hypothetical protein